MTDRKERLAMSIAYDLDRLAYLVDPYEYFNAVGQTIEDTQHNMQTIQRDLLAGKTQPYIDWCLSLVQDENQDRRDRARAASRLSSLLRFKA